MAVNVHGSVWWTELLTRDLPGGRDFCEAVFGWRVEETRMPDGPYHLCLIDDVPVAGIVDMGAMPNLDGVGAHWLTFVAVAGLDTALAAAVTSGGVIQRPPFCVPLVGRLAIVSEPGGAPVGLVQPDP